MGISPTPPNNQRSKVVILRESCKPLTHFFMLILHAINTTDIQRIAPAFCLKLSVDFRQSSRNIESKENSAIGYLPNSPFDGDVIIAMSVSVVSVSVLFSAMHNFGRKILNKTFIYINIYIYIYIYNPPG